MTKHSEEIGLPVVAVELDCGPIEMAFGYVPVGVPAYSDVAPELWPQPTDAEAEMVGARMLAIGNWRSFRVEKRWWPASEWLVETSVSGSSEVSDG